MDKKKKNVVLVTLLVLAILGLAIFGILLPKIKKVNNFVKTETDEYNNELIVPENIINGEESSIDGLQKAMLNGQTFIATSDTNDFAYSFEFREDGTFKGHTQAENDDLGSWEVENQNGTRYLVITTTNGIEKYIISYNNNNDITLQAEDGTVYILTQKH